MGGSILLPSPVRGTLFALQWVDEMTRATRSALRRGEPTTFCREQDDGTRRYLQVIARAIC